MPKRSVLWFLQAAFLIIAPIHLSPPSANAEESPAMDLPDDLPFPPEIRDIKSAGTANTVCVKFLVDGTIKELRDQLEKSMAQHGWTVEDVRLSGREFLHGVAVKGPRRLFVNALHDKATRVQECTFRTTDSSVQHCNAEAAANPTAAEAAQVLEKLRTTYRNAQSYYDRGEQHTKFISSGPGNHQNTLRYVTAFARPDEFRFEFTDDMARFIVHQSGADIRSHWTLGDEEEVHDTLANAVAGPTGISGGTVGLAAHLLGILHDYDVASEMRDPILLPEATIQDTSCYVVYGYDRSCEEYTLWISKNEHLLLQMQETAIFPDMKSITTTTIEPHLNKPIPSESLAFNKDGMLPMKPATNPGILQGFVNKIEGSE